MIVNYAIIIIVLFDRLERTPTLIPLLMIQPATMSLPLCAEMIGILINLPIPYP
jgi:hypothetical protein